VRVAQRAPQRPAAAGAALRIVLQQAAAVHDEYL